MKYESLIAKVLQLITSNLPWLEVTAFLKLPSEVVSRDTSTS